MSCRYGEGLSFGSSLQGNLPKEVFKAFVGAKVKRAQDGEKLKYWDNWSLAKPNEETYTSDLLKNGDAQCYNWAALFLDTLRVQGVTYTDVPQGGEPQGYYPLVRVDPAYTDKFFLIGNKAKPSWKFVDSLGKGNEEKIGDGGRIRSYLYRNVRANNDDMTSPVMKSFDIEDYIYGNNRHIEPVQDNKGSIQALPAQNNSNPLAMFGNHALVFISDTLYDPSYGVAYSGNIIPALESFQKEAIQYFGTFDARTKSFYFREPNANELDFKFTRLKYPSQ